MIPDIRTYNNSQTQNDKSICDVLFAEIESNLSGAKAKIWHAHPVWFLDDNPIVGYSVLKDSVRLMFWSGQSFKEKGLNENRKF
ncbi:MAG TPA: hypothetical protein VD884_06685 [Ohtaekwangia sp.]|nr:hypothetical protein [Ohtaekwangia sp.]